MKIRLHDHQESLVVVTQILPFDNAIMSKEFNRTLHEDCYILTLCDYQYVGDTMAGGRIVYNRRKFYYLEEEMAQQDLNKFNRLNNTNINNLYTPMSTPYIS